MTVNTRIPKLGIRWTIGDVSDPGFATLRLSILSCWRLFGEAAQFAVCVNSIHVQDAITKAGNLPCDVIWIDANKLIPDWLRRNAGAGMAEGVAWKFAPVRMWRDRHELALDNDIVLWRTPVAMRAWLESCDSCLMSADVRPALGQFTALCGERALNSGIRGFYPGFDMEGALLTMLQRSRIKLRSELDEQGLQAAVLSRSKLHVIPTSDVSICSPFPMHERRLGNCGVHFVGINPETIPWTLEGRPGHELVVERWRSFLPQVEELIGAQSTASTGAIATLRPVATEALSRAADAP